MKIDATRYAMFWANPERYRLSEVWKVKPVEPTPGSVGAMRIYGRRRGSAFHELLDAHHKGLDRTPEQYLKASGYAGSEGDSALRLFNAVQDKYPNEKYVAHEVTFEFRIPQSVHVMTGRIDHILNHGDDTPVYVVGDWKTSKKRTVADMADRIRQYEKSVQVDFYLLGAQSLGYPPFQFLYRVLEDRGPGMAPNVHEAWTQRGQVRLNKFARGVHQTCELIEFLKRTYGVEKPWPFVPERYETGYENIEGYLMYENFIPDGFTERVEHLSSMEGPSCQLQ